MTEEPEKKFAFNPRTGRTERVYSWKRNRPLKNYIGNKYGLVTVVSEAKRSPSGKRRFNCVCECGTEMVAIITNLNKKNTEYPKSCGCATPIGKRKPTNTVIGHETD